MKNLTVKLLQASKPSSRRGCAEILGYSYLRQVPLTRTPNYGESSVDTELLPLTPNYYVSSYHRMVKAKSTRRSCNGKTPLSTTRHQQRIRMLQSLTNIMTQWDKHSHELS